MIRGGLFSRYYLDDGIRETDAYRALDPAQVLAFADDVRGLWRRLEPMARPSEEETAVEFIFPVLDRLGWHWFTQQTPGAGRQDVADALLFLTEAAKDAARPLPSVDRFRLGAVVVENEARDTVLDRASGHGEAPSTQILRYLGRADPVAADYDHAAGTAETAARVARARRCRGRRRRWHRRTWPIRCSRAAT